MVWIKIGQGILNEKILNLGSIFKDYSFFVLEKVDRHLSTISTDVKLAVEDGACLARKKL